MKKLVAIIMVAVLAVSLLAGSGSDSSSDSSDVKLSSVLAKINEKYPEAVNGLTELKEKSDLTRYYEIDEKDINDFAAEIIKDSSKASLEIVLVKTENPDDVKDKLDLRYKAILSQYASYSADQLKLAKEGGVESTGDYVYLVVAENSKDIMKTIADELD